MPSDRPDASVFDLLEHGARRDPWRPAVLFRERAVTYGELREWALRLATWLRARGVAPGARVALLAANRPEWLAAYFGTLAAGGTAMTINPALKPAEVARILGHGEPAVLFAEAATLATAEAARRAAGPAAALALLEAAGRPGLPGMAELLAGPPLEPVRAQGGAAGAVVCYTSGTAGAPKGVLQSHANEVWAASACRRLWAVTARDRILVPMSLAFLYALSTECLTAVSAGAAVILLERFHPRLALAAIERHRATVVMGVPTMYRMMLDLEGQEAFDVSSLRLAVTAGAPVAAPLLEAFERRAGVPLHDYYAVSEAKPLAGYPAAGGERPRPGSCGRPVEGMEVRLVDETGRPVAPGETGEIVVRGPGLVAGYFRAGPAERAAFRGGWFHTGDLARRDAAGYVYLVDRKTDLIIRGGANIAPAEVEAALYAHPAVAEAAVVGLPDRVFGERVRAVVAFRPGASATADELRGHCLARLADYKVPEVIDVVSELPKGPTGKILRRLVRDSVQRGGEA